MSAPPVEPMFGFKFGCDPEVFILNGEGRPVSAELFIPGTKAEPYKVEKGAVQVDGVAAEFNIDPASTFEEFDLNIKTVMGKLKSYLPKDHTLSVVPFVEFDESGWASVSDQAKELGCTPDFNAWDGSVNPPPECLERPRMRTASGHLHIGWTEDESIGDPQHVTNCRDLVQQLDWYLGAWSVKHDSDPTRRKLYGKAGACRYKPYGVEYRVLSNFWLTSKERRLAVWNRMNTAINVMAHSFFPAKYPSYNLNIVHGINESDLGTFLPKKFHYPITQLV